MAEHGKVKKKRKSPPPRTKHPQWYYWLVEGCKEMCNLDPCDKFVCTDEEFNQIIHAVLDSGVDLSDKEKVKNEAADALTSHLVSVGRDSLLYE